MKSIAIAWNVLLGVIYVCVVFGILSAASSRFETLVLAILIELYAAVLFNFSILGEATDINNHAAFVRFRLLAANQGTTETEDGKLVDQEQVLVDAVKTNRPKIIIWRISNGLVSAYAMFKIIQQII